MPPPKKKIAPNAGDWENDIRRRSPRISSYGSVLNMTWTLGTGFVGLYALLPSLQHVKEVDR